MLLLILAAGPSLANPTGETVLMPAKAGGGWFSRKKFEEFLEEEEKLREALRKGEQDKREKELADAYAEFRSPADRIVKELLDNANAAAAQYANRPLSSPGHITVGPDYSMFARIHAHRMQDEDDAIALLLLNGG